MPAVRRYVTDLGRSDELVTLDAAGKPTGETRHLPRYGVWEEGAGHRKPEVIATGDDLQRLCADHGLDPKDVIRLGPKPEPAG